jgi:2'-5' RNA ligase
MRLFIAIDCKKLEESLLQIQKGIDLTLTNLKLVSTFHLTLKFLGEVQESQTEQIKSKLKQIRFSPFSINLDKVGVFPSENFIKVIWVGITPEEQVLQIQKQVEDALKEFNFKKEHKFHPHLTLARVKFIKDKEKFNKNLKEIKVPDAKVEVKDLRLIKSTLKPEGPVYEDVQVFS